MRRWRRLIGALAVAATFAGVSGTVAAPAWAEGAAVSTPPVGPEGHGVTIPDGRNQAVGDVLGLGFEQLIRLNGSKVEITAPSAFGGELLETFEVGAKQRYPRPSTLTGARTYPGLEKLEKVTDRTNEASRLAVAGDAIFVSTILGKDYADPTGSIVQKYVVQHDGDRRVLEKQNEYKLDGANLAVTALDAYVHDGQEYVAAGLNTTGVRILQATAGEPGQLGSFRVFRHVHADWDGRLGWWERDMVTTVQLGTDKQKRLILIAGKITYEHPAIVATDLRAGERVDDTGNHVYLWKNNDRWLDLGDMLNDRFEWPDVVEFGTVGPQETPIVAISWPTRNRTSFLFPDSGVTWNWTDGISPTTAVRYFTDGEGNNRVFVRRAPAGPILGMSAGGQWEFYEDVDDARVQSAVPGYRVWNLTLENQSRHDVTLTPYRGSTRLEGCWYGDDLSTDRPLPATRIDLRAGGAAGPFVTARRTSGAACGNDHPGVLYAQVAPKGAPEQAQIVKLLGDVAGLRLDQEVGAGALTVRTERDGMFDVRLVVTDRHEAPTPVKAPTLTASRLTPAPAPTYKPTDYLDDPTRPVFRFTVTDQRWHVPGADELTNVTLPVPTVEASTDQNTWTALGTTTSPLAPTRSETEPTELTLGDSTFYWQTTPGATDYRYFRLTLPDGTTSDTLDTTTLEAPQPSTKIYGNGQLSPNVSGSGLVRANGLGQATLRMTMKDGNSAGIDPQVYPGLYDRFYFRDKQTQELLTGLGDPKNPGSVTTITPRAGQFADPTASDNLSRSIPLFVSTTNARPGQGVDVMFKPDATVASTFSHSFSLDPVTQNLAVAGTGGDGLTIPSGCATGACDFAAPRPDRPVLYRANEATVSLQLKAHAIPGSLSLPLTQPQTPAELNTLLQDSLTFSPGKALLAHPQLFGSDETITTYLVSNGTLVSAANLWARPRD